MPHPDLLRVLVNKWEMEANEHDFPDNSEEGYVAAKAECIEDLRKVLGQEGKGRD